MIARMGAALILAAMAAVVFLGLTEIPGAPGSPGTTDAHYDSYNSLKQSHEHAHQGSPTCIRFGGCGYLSDNDHKLTAVDNWGDGRKIIAWGQGCGRTYSVADPDGKGGRVGVRRVNCNLNKHWLVRRGANGVVKFSGTSGH